MPPPVSRPRPAAAQQLHGGEEPAGGATGGSGSPTWRAILPFPRRRSSPGRTRKPPPVTAALCHAAGQPAETAGGKRRNQQEPDLEGDPPVLPFPRRRSSWNRTGKPPAGVVTAAMVPKKVTVEAHYYPKWCPHVPGRSRGDYAIAVTRLVHRDLLGVASELRDLRCALRRKGTPMTGCRILNALMWAVLSRNEGQLRGLANRK
jgi:hypothetical protein